jgi:hypothetical protein
MTLRIVSANVSTSTSNVDLTIIFSLPFENVVFDRNVAAGGAKTLGGDALRIFILTYTKI